MAEILYINGTAPAAASFEATGAMFFALMPGDNADTVSQGAEGVAFPQAGPTFGADAPTSLTAETFRINVTGTYLITYQVSVTEAGQLQMWRNGAALVAPDFSTAGRATGTSQIANSFLITLADLDVISINNPSGNAAALTITPTAGGTVAVSATLTITRVA